MKGLTIGQVAKRGEVKIETVRYYERQELIPPPHRESRSRRALRRRMVKIEGAAVRMAAASDGK